MDLQTIWRTSILRQEPLSIKEIPEDWARKYIGARGLGVRYMFENGPEVEPLSPDNLLCFMNGPLTGTAANMSGRMADCHEIAADQWRHRQPSWRMVGRAFALGRL